MTDTPSFILKHRVTPSNIGQANTNESLVDSKSKKKKNEKEERNNWFVKTN